jgi:hypothetical protein
VKITNEFPGEPGPPAFRWSQQEEDRVHVTASDGARWEVAEDDGGHLYMHRIAYAPGVNPRLTTAKQTVEHIDACWVALDNVTDIHGVNQRQFTDMTADDVRSMMALLSVAQKALAEARDVARRAATRASLGEVKS